MDAILGVKSVFPAYYSLGPGRNNYYLRTYGISKDKYEKLLDSQDGTCAICGEVEDRRRMSIDHCHETGDIRGVVCTLCNNILGNARDNVKILASAIEYLKLARVTQQEE